MQTMCLRTKLTISEILVLNNLRLTETQQDRVSAALCMKLCSTSGNNLCISQSHRWMTLNILLSFSWDLQVREGRSINVCALLLVWAAWECRAGCKCVWGAEESLFLPDQPASAQLSSEHPPWSSHCTPHLYCHQKHKGRRSSGISFTLKTHFLKH